jgi:hypothetical protein
MACTENGNELSSLPTLLSPSLQTFSVPAKQRSPPPFSHNSRRTKTREKIIGETAKQFIVPTEISTNLPRFETTLRMQIECLTKTPTLDHGDEPQASVVQISSPPYRDGRATTEQCRYPAAPQHIEGVRARWEGALPRTRGLCCAVLCCKTQKSQSWPPLVSIPLLKHEKMVSFVSFMIVGQVWSLSFRSAW